MIVLHLNNLPNGNINEVAKFGKKFDIILGRSLINILKICGIIEIRETNHERTGIFDL